MTAEKFYATLDLMKSLDTKLAIQTSLATVGSSLANLVNQPSQPQYQATLAQAMEALKNADNHLGLRLSASDLESIEELGGGEYFNKGMFQTVRSVIAANAMTPSVANDTVRKLVSQRQEFMETVRVTHDGMETLGVSATTLEPGTADMSFVIPRDIFNNDIAELAKELEFVNRLVRVVTEATTGTVEPVRLEYLSSSIPTVAIMAAVPVVAGLATIIEKFLAGWERIEKIRSLRAGISEVGLKGAAVEELTQGIQNTVEEIVEESTTLTLRNYRGEAGRKNELDNGLRQEIKRLFGQVERGLTIDFRAAEPDKADTVEPDTAAAIKEIRRVGRTAHFPEPSELPLLLANSEVLDGEIVIESRRKKTTASKTKASAG